MAFDEDTPSHGRARRPQDLPWTQHRVSSFTEKTHIELSGDSQDLKGAQDGIKDISKYAHHVESLVNEIELSNEGKARVDETSLHAHSTRMQLSTSPVAADLAKTDTVLLAATLLKAVAE